MFYKVTIDDKSSLVDVLKSMSSQFIVVEGYNGVGKSYVIRTLQDSLNAPVYRPDYNGWAGEIPRELRWAIFCSILSASECMEFRGQGRLIFDRGMLSGAVYNEDPNIMNEYYNDLLNNEKVLHILVTVPDSATYYSLNQVRASEKVLKYEDYVKYTERYRKYLEDARIPYIEYINRYDGLFALEAEATCIGCSHYNMADSKCKHPKINAVVDAYSLRCEHSSDKEVQDGKDMQLV